MVLFTSNIYCMNNYVMTSKLSIAYIYTSFQLVAVTLCDKFQSISYFRVVKGGLLFERWALIRERHLYDNHVSRVGAYSREALNRSITVCKYL